MKKILILLFLLLSTISFTYAQEEFDFKSNYSRAEHMIEMRDGIKLHTVIYAPKNAVQDYPIILFRTPYYNGRGGPDDYYYSSAPVPHPKMAEEGYIFVIQSVRGTGKSEGSFSDIRPPIPGPTGTDDSSDNYDAIDWIVKNIPNNNGRVGQWGISHPGFYTVMGMINAHPALKAASPQATTGDPFIGDDGHRNGIFRLMPKVLWAAGSMMRSAADDRNAVNRESIDFDYGTNWSYEFFLNSGPINKLNEKYFDGRLGSWWEDIIEHPNYDEYYQKRHIPKYMNNINVPTLNVLGWFDAPDPYGAIATYHGIEKRTPNNNSVIVAGPWQHGNWKWSNGNKLGDIDFGSNTADYFNINIIKPFFDYYLKDKGKWNPPEAQMYETGGNKWHSFEQWPPKEIQYKALYLNDNFKVSFDPPKTDGKDQYTNNPEKPVPFTTKIDFTFPGGEYRILDQRFATTRADVLTYTSQLLEEDITIAGPILPMLYTETTGTDADWFVKVIDVYPPDAKANSEGVEMKGYQMLVGAEGMRAKYRDSLSDPAPVVPNEITEINFEIRDKFHTFKKGHKIMIQIHSTWFPIYDRNPGQFMNIYGADKNDYLTTNQTIHRSKGFPSNIKLPIFTK